MLQSSGLGPLVGGRVQVGVHATKHACKPTAGAAPPSPPVRGSSDCCLGLCQGRPRSSRQGESSLMPSPQDRCVCCYSTFILHLVDRYKTGPMGFDPHFGTNPSAGYPVKAGSVVCGVEKHRCEYVVCMWSVNMHSGCVV